MTDGRGAKLKEIGEQWFDALNNQNPDGLDKVVAEDVIVHSDNLPATIHGRVAYKQAVGAFGQAFPDLNFTVEDVIVDVGGEMIAVRTTNTGTFKGELMGIPPTGKPFRS
jgi:predicted ester cyclase